MQTLPTMLEAPEPVPSPPAAPTPRPRDRRSALAALTPTAPLSPAAAGRPASPAPAFVARVDRVLAECRRYDTPMAVLSIAIETLTVGDAAATPAVESAVALEFGHRLRGRVRSTDVVVWVGGREYGVVLLEAGIEGARTVRNRLLAALGGTYRLESQLAQATLSVGLAAYPMAGSSASALVSAAMSDRRDR